MARSIISVDSSSNFGGHTTITSALRSNVTIYIHKGTYTENLDFTGLTGIIIYCLPGVSLTGTITAQGTNKIIYAEKKSYRGTISITAGKVAPTHALEVYNTVGVITLSETDENYVYQFTIPNTNNGQIVIPFIGKNTETSDISILSSGLNYNGTSFTIDCTAGAGAGIYTFEFDVI